MASKANPKKQTKPERTASLQPAEICHAWNEPLTPDVIEYVEKQFGPLANTLGDLVVLVRRIGEWYVIPYSDDPFRTVKASKLRMLRNACDMRSKLVEFLNVPSEIHGLVVQALVSTRRLRPVIEMVIGKDAAAQFYDRLCRDTTIGWGLVIDIESSPVCLGRSFERSKTYEITEAAEELNQRALLMDIKCLRGGASEKDLTNSKKQSKPYSFGPQFRSANWYGNLQSFTSTQAAVVEILADAYEAGTPDIDAGVLVGEGAFTQDNLKAKGKKPSAAKRVRDLFRGNPAWGTMIVPGGTRGTYRLKKP